jgi:hypothetical protein
MKKTGIPIHFGVLTIYAHYAMAKMQSVHSQLWYHHICADSVTIPPEE